MGSGSRSWYGWLVLLGALAVPAVLFWNWWGKMQGSSAASLGVRNRIGSSAGARMPKVSTMSLVAVSKPAQAIPASSAPSRPPAGDKETLEYEPTSTRDPTLSPIDLKALEEMRNRPKAVKPRRVEKPIEELLELQGVVATSGGIMALVNGERLRQGDRILGATVRRITTNFVEFRYEGRTFRKKVE